jgi:hypothetical protein
VDIDAWKPARIRSGRNVSVLGCKSESQTHPFRSLNDVGIVVAVGIRARTRSRYSVSLNLAQGLEQVGRGALSAKTSQWRVTVRVGADRHQARGRQSPYGVPGKEVIVADVGCLAAGLQACGRHSGGHSLDLDRAARFQAGHESARNSSRFRIVDEACIE